MSSPTFDALPGDYGGEVAFAGRSNAGKSSVLNTLVNRKNLAKTSSTPGKTRHINLFTLGESGETRIADLPGYGFARVSSRESERWQNELTRYILERKCLKGVVVITDIRRGLTELDRKLIALCGSKKRSIHILLNKADKLKSGQRAAAVHKTGKELSDLLPGTGMEIFSSVSPGQFNCVPLLWKVLDDWLEGI